jgi:hypothetical protein
MTQIVLGVAVISLAFAIPASAGDIYTNGPINGQTDAWTINFGFVTSDSFIVSGGNGAVAGFSFGAWLFPGDTLNSVELSITSQELGGTTYFDQVISLTASNCFINQFGFNVCQETSMFTGPNLADGNYWVNLGNAVVDNGDPVYWDENDGPSFASDNSVGSLPSESFTIIGNGQTNGTVPEPGSILLITSGAVGALGLLRRKRL